MYVGKHAIFIQNIGTSDKSRLYVHMDNIRRNTNTLPLYVYLNDHFRTQSVVGSGYQFDVTSDSMLSLLESVVISASKMFALPHFCNIVVPSFIQFPGVGNINVNALGLYILYLMCFKEPNEIVTLNRIQNKIIFVKRLDS